VSDVGQLIAVNEDPKPVFGVAGVLSDVNCVGYFARPETLAN
jgi:hypothetical protein